jgi:predicted Zn-dependent peptidase
MDSIKREIIGKGVNFNTVSDSRFKTMRLSVSFVLPLTKENAGTNALLSGVLTRTTDAYPDFTVLSKKLAELYGANLFGFVRKMGDNQILTFTISGIDDKYAFKSDKVSASMSQLMCDVIFRPKLKGESFCTDEINQEKRQLKDLIDSEYNEKRIYANNRFTEIMCKDEPFGISKYGKKEEIDSISGENLYLAWKNMLSFGNVEIFFIGDSDSDSAKNIFKNEFQHYSREPYKINNIIPLPSSALKEEKEVMELSQSKMIMGFRTDITGKSEDSMAMRVAVALLGGTAHSKLFNNVREKLSLCYYCSARYNRVKGIVTIESGVEKDNIEKAKSAILNELQEMVNGNITDFELDATKLSMCNDFVSVCDFDSGIETWYLTQLMDSGFDSVEEACSKVNSVTKEQVVKMASKLHFDTIYVLESE